MSQAFDHKTDGASSPNRIPMPDPIQPYGAAGEDSDTAVVEQQRRDSEYPGLYLTDTVTDSFNESFCHDMPGPSAGDPHHEYHTRDTAGGDVTFNACQFLQHTWSSQDTEYVPGQWGPLSLPDNASNVNDDFYAPFQDRAAEWDSYNIDNVQTQEGSVSNSENQTPTDPSPAPQRKIKKRGASRSTRYSEWKKSHPDAEQQITDLYVGQRPWREIRDACGMNTLGDQEFQACLANDSEMTMLSSHLQQNPRGKGSILSARCTLDRAGFEKYAEFSNRDIAARTGATIAAVRAHRRRLRERQGQGTTETTE